MYLSDGSTLDKFKQEFRAGGLGNININMLDNQNGESAIASVLQSYREGSKLLGKNTFLDQIKIKLSDKPDEFKSIKTAFENYEHRLNFKKTKVDPLIQQRAALMEKPGVKAAVEAARKAERSVTKPKKP